MHVTRPSSLSQAAAMAVNRTQGVKNDFNFVICQCYFHYGHCDFKKNKSSAKYKNNVTKNDMYLSLADYHVTSIKFVGKCIHMELFESRDLLKQI